MTIALTSNRKRQLIIAVILLVAMLAALWLYRRQQNDIKEHLLTTSTEQIPNDPVLMALGRKRGPRMYQERCASCHGADMKGNRSKGIPDLQDRVWVFGSGSINDIEQIILYGIRSGHPKAHRLTDMPGLGRSGQLQPAEIRDVVEYVLKISHQTYDEAAAQRGDPIFHNSGVCYDCHSGDGQGISDYGAPALTGKGNAWLYGGDRATLYKTVFDGRHGLCPAWINTLSFADIRLLAIYIYDSSHHSATTTASPSLRAGTAEHS